MKAPFIDNRSVEDLLAQLRELAPFYTPEWKADGEKDAGNALANIFALFYHGILQRLNQVPDKHFIAYLNMLGIKRQPALPAKAPVTFELSKGAAEPVFIPAGTQTAAQDAESGKPIVFETEKTIMATPAKLEELICFHPKHNGIYRPPAGFPRSAGQTDGGQSPIFELFTGDNLQEHIVYLGHSELFNVKSKAEFVLNFGNSELKYEAVRLLGTEVNWEYWSEQGHWEQLTARPIYDDDLYGNKLGLIKETWNDQIGELEIGGIKSRWIRGIAAPSKIGQLQTLRLEPFTIEAGHEENGWPTLDLAFCNDVPLEVKDSGFYPFGETPRRYDVTYWGSQEVFSKKGAWINIEFRLEHRNANGSKPPAIDASLSWEYWDGRGWMKIPGVDEHLRIGTYPDGSVYYDRRISFANPEQIAATEVQGQQNFWIRARIVSGGYGGVPAGAAEPVYYPPLIKNLRIYYYCGETPQHILTQNNLDLQDRTKELIGGKPLQLFHTLADKQPSLYFGFDRAPLKGPISMYIAMKEQEYAEEDRPRIVWEYYRERNGTGEWAKLDVRDMTRHLTQSGTVEWIGLPDFKPLTLFGKQLYWIRAIDADGKFVPAGNEPPSRLRNPAQAGPQQSLHLLKSAPAYRSAQQADELRVGNNSAGVQRTSKPSMSINRPADPGEPNGGCGCGQSSCADALSPCAESMELIDPRALFRSALSGPPSPKLSGVYLNTVMASQAVTIMDERFGSSSGKPSQMFALTKFPVIDEEIYVNEMNALSEGERQALKESGAFIKEVQDEAGRTIEFWVRWQSVEQIADSAPGQRHYEIDRTAGTILFGDGANGMIPPAGADNLRASYRTGGGVKGNVGRSDIGKLLTSIAFVDRVSNPEAASGGYDTESMERVLERGPLAVKHRNRAVSAKDYEQLALEAAQGIARVKCLPNVNDKGEAESGWVTVVVVPQSSESRPVPSVQLKRQVLSYLRKRAPNIVTMPNRLNVIGPAYVEISISAVLVSVSFEAAPLAEQEAVKKLKSFLHPLYGGAEGKGWEFGRFPCMSDFYFLLESDRNTDHVEDLQMTIRDPLSGKTIVMAHDAQTEAAAPPYVLIYSGEHAITVKALTGSVYETNAN